MADSLAGALKQEITRLARKSMKQELASLQAASSSQRKQITALKRQVADLERQIRRGQKGEKASSKAAASDADAPDSSLRFQIRGLKSMRERLGLSAAELAKLAGVSGQSIYNWETGKSKPRQTQIAALAALRGIGKREALRRLEALSGTEEVVEAEAS